MFTPNWRLYLLCCFVIIIDTINSGNTMDMQGYEDDEDLLKREDTQWRPVQLGGTTRSTLTPASIAFEVTEAHIQSQRDSKTCISRGSGESDVVSVQYCLVTKRDIKLLCPSSTMVVLSGLKMAVKRKNEFCMKRVPGPESEFCCYIQKDDVLYDSHCLYSIWNTEDKNYYREFVEQALDKCTNTSQCVLKSEMFANLQKKIPTTDKYSSYVEVLYKCIPASTSHVSRCSSRPVIGQEIHFTGTSRSASNKTCSCHVTSQGDNVIVSAIDVRTPHSGLLLSSGKTVKNISHDLPLFGMREIFAAKRVNISVKFDSIVPGDHLWLHLAGSNGKDVNLNCGETVPHEEITSIIPGVVPFSDTSEDNKVLWGYWPLIYVASGSLFTIFLVFCILITVLVSNYRKRKKRRHHMCVHPPLSSPADFQHDPYMYDPAYATVLEDAQGHQHHLQDQREMRSMSSLAADRFYVKQAVNNLRPPTAPPPPPPPPNTSTAGLSCDVSELEAFLECKAPSHRDVTLRNSHHS